MGNIKKLHADNSRVIRRHPYNARNREGNLNRYKLVSLNLALIVSKARPTWDWRVSCGPSSIPRKEVIQPHLPVRLPCYDFTPVIEPTLDTYPLLAVVGPAASGLPNSHGVTGGVYKAREHIHRGVLTHGY